MPDHGGSTKANRHSGQRNSAKGIRAWWPAFCPSSKDSVPQIRQRGRLTVDRVVQVRRPRQLTSVPLLTSGSARNGRPKLRRGVAPIEVFIEAEEIRIRVR